MFLIGAFGRLDFEEDAPTSVYYTVVGILPSIYYVVKRILPPVPSDTEAVARAAFPKGNFYVLLRDNLGSIYLDIDFTTLFSQRGQPAESPWRLAIISVMQFIKNLSDRQAAEAVRSRIDWKYALSLPLTAPGFHFSILCEFRQRLIEGNAEQLLLDKLLEQLRNLGLLKEKRQRTDRRRSVSGSAQLMF